MSDVLVWSGNHEKAFAIRLDGQVLAVRYGSQITLVSEVEDRIKRGEMGDDLPILMEDFGCDYETACDAVFGGDPALALAMLHQARREVSTVSNMAVDRPRTIS